MLTHLRDKNFKSSYLEYVFQDPVHNLTDERPLDRRCRYDRNIFFLLENDVPVAVLCIAYSQGLPDSIEPILDANSPVSLTASHAIFYSVFKTNQTTSLKNVGATIIRQAAQWIQENLPHISNFVTMSPIPNLTAHFNEPPTVDAVVEFLKAQGDPVARFHLANGAKVLRAIPNADLSEKRKAQSFGLMVNYDYTPNLTKGNNTVNN